ncbi:stage II sporulation protein M [Phycisphaerales bacterium AB-hyl4]|uniref:Stage II sporulation protein M n=1 Tax=Natronomicrosphaera hydrolytica TaxID=3242702 RepID=A0ABV4U8F6_9BACT
MELNQFIRQRRPRWERLDVLLTRLEEKGADGLAPEQVDELFSLYRLTSSDLNIAQTQTANPALLESLEHLVGRAYAQLTVPRRVQPFRAYWRIIRHTFPALMRREKRLLGLATLGMLTGMLFGFLGTMIHPDTSLVFISAFPYHLEQSPAERVANLEAMEAEGVSQIQTAGDHANFTAQLMTHNIRVTILAFALGLTFGVGTMIVLFYNGCILGSLAYLYYDDQQMLFFLAWIGPHGAIELPCILFGCTAGFMLARAQLNFDGGSLRQQLRAMRPSLVHILVGAATLLVIAAVIEGGFSQINEPTLPYALKVAVAALLFVALLAYLFVMPVAPGAGDRSGDLVGRGGGVPRV